MGLVALFPGQGSQFAGMGNNLIDKKNSKFIFQKARKILGFDILNVMLYGNEEDIKATRVTQPAVFLYSVCLIEEYREILMEKVEAAAGHSLGEITAVYFADGVSLEDALFLIKERAEGIQDASMKNPSTMMALITSNFTKIEEICQEISQNGEIVVPANYNAPEQIVISGTLHGIELASKKIKELGIKGIPLKVGGGFHSPLMKSAKEKFKIAIEKVNLNSLRIPVYANLDGLPYKSPQEIKDKLVNQITSPVKWYQSIINLINDGFDTFVEIGPGNVLSNMLRRYYPKVKVISFSEIKGNGKT